MSNLDVPVNNTPYSDEELEHFRRLLLEEREEAAENAKEAKESLEDQRSLDNERASSKDHHPGNIATEEEEKETTYLLRERSREKIEKIDAAIKRIENKTYGICEDTGKKIQEERLEAIPYTRFSVEAREKDESDHPGPQV
ncbi:MAG TPA: TraR/DksA C4-type zinc finger protein [Fodinibius sp.]|nr:TraR/DksA C4-type zinc finger protein [Fodinibius sp.]